MLQAINDKAKGCLGIAIVVVIGLAFSLWGVESYLNDSGPQYAAKINDSEISLNEFERTVSLNRMRLTRENDGKLPFEEKVLRNQTMNQIVNQRLLEVTTFDNGYRISDPFVAEKIRQQFTIDGVFDRQSFEMGVSRLGMSVPMYENYLRSEMRVNQLQNAITNSAFVTDEQVRHVASLVEQTRDIAVLTFDVQHYSTAGTPSEDEIKQYYDNNRSAYMLPEKVKVDYVELRSESLTEDIEVDESQIQQMYDDYVASVAGREERKASHILILSGEDEAAAREKIDSLKQQIDQGADFAELAKQNSQDTASADEGGELGWISHGDMAKPFEKALFDMEMAGDGVTPGDTVVSEVVETQFGLHLIRLEDVRREEPEPLGVKRYEFEDEIRKEAAASLFYDQSERLATLAYENPDNLDLVKEELGLEVVTSEAFSRDKGEALFANPEVRSVAFSPLVLQDNSNSDIIEISPTHVVVLRLSEHTPEVAIPLDVVRSSIIARITKDKGFEQARAAAMDVKNKIESGSAIDSFASQDGMTLEMYDGIGRRGNDKLSSPAILKTAFEIVPEQSEKVAARLVNQADGNLALVVLKQTHAPVDIAKETIDSIKQGLTQESANIDISNALTYMKNNASIDTNKRLIQDE